MLALVGVEGAYVVGGNLLLALGGVQKAFEYTDTIKFDFAHAWTVWPGVVHASGVRGLDGSHGDRYWLCPYFRFARCS